MKRQEREAEEEDAAKKRNKLGGLRCIVEMSQFRVCSESEFSVH